MVIPVIIGFFLIIAGIIGCVLPMVPGPILSYTALIMLSISNHWKPFQIAFLVVMGIITLVVTFLGYVMP